MPLSDLAKVMILRVCVEDEQRRRNYRPDDAGHAALTENHNEKPAGGESRQYNLSDFDLAEPIEQNVGALLMCLMRIYYAPKTLSNLALKRGEGVPRRFKMGMLIQRSLSTFALPTTPV